MPPLALLLVTDWHHRSLNSESETAPIQSSADNARTCSSSKAAHDLRGAFSINAFARPVLHAYKNAGDDPYYSTD
jgi:hypothetical protein